MTRTITALVVAVALFLGQTNILWAQQRSRGSVSASSSGSGTTRRGGSYTTSGSGSGSWTSRGGNVQGWRTTTKTDEGYNVNKTITTDAGASKTPNPGIMSRCSRRSLPPTSKTA